MSSTKDHNHDAYRNASIKTGTITTIQETFQQQRHNKSSYLTGLRGILVIQSLIWVYFQTFIPGVVSQAVDIQTSAPTYQTIIRDVFSVLFWNESFIYNALILLSMRTIAMSYLENPNGQSYAAAVIRRIVRMVLVLSAASGLATLIFSQIGTTFIEDFITTLPNSSIEAPVKTYDALSAFNSLFNLFWLTTGFYTQAANTFWPTQTLWVSAVMYYQSWTVYFLMVFLPFTRPKWHLQGLTLFALGSFWMQSWGWYSATGLFFADLSINMTLNSSFRRGIRMTESCRLPYWIVAIISLVAGLVMKYTFTILPQYQDSELVLHPYLDLSQMYTPSTTIAAGPYPRIDDLLVVVGLFILIEYLTPLQHALSWKPLLVLGERSFSIFVAQSIVFWTAGTKLWLVLHAEAGLSIASANVVVLVICIVAIAVFAELFYRVVDLPSKWIARNSYKWLVN